MWYGFCTKLFVDILNTDKCVCGWLERILTNQNHCEIDSMIGKTGNIQRGETGRKEGNRRRKRGERDSIHEGKTRRKRGETVSTKEREGSEGAAEKRKALICLGSVEVCTKTIDKVLLPTSLEGCIKISVQYKYISIYHYTPSKIVWRGGVLYI